MHSRNDNIKFTSYNAVNEVVDDFFESLLWRYQRNLETSMRVRGSFSFQIRGRDFIFDSVQLMYYKCDKVNFRLGSSYMDFSDWIKKSNNKSAK